MAWCGLPLRFAPMRFEGHLTHWNDERGFGRIAPVQGGEPIFVHVSAWPRGVGRPRLGQAVSFEVELGPKGKRACRVQVAQARASAARPAGGQASAWGMVAWLLILASLFGGAVAALFWSPPARWMGWYLGLSGVTFLAYAIDKSAARRSAWRTREDTLHLLALAGGWPGAWLAHRLLHHKSTKPAFRRVFWLTVVLNVAGLAAVQWGLRR